MNRGSFQGFKLENGHVKLGSKIHVRDFYYVSKMFQNNYFANQFAIQVAKFIIDNLANGDLGGIERFGLISYGKYSELLLVRVTTLVNNFYKRKGQPIFFDYNIVSDAEELVFLRRFDNVRDCLIKMYFIIVPIGSTLTTCVKIFNLLIASGVPDVNIRKPFLNILLVVDDEFDQARKGMPMPDIFQRFGWQKIENDNKTIVVKTYNTAQKSYRNLFTESEVPQHFFVELITKWFTINNCQLCFPEHSEEEVPIIETDRASVIPQLLLSSIFPFTGSGLVKYTKGDFILQPEYYYYGHQVFGDSEHVHFINPNEFLTRHREEVVEWLKNEIKSKDWIAKHSNKQTILLTPEGNLNSSFVNIVNEVLFSDSANIVQYDTKNDFVQNFVSLYQETLRTAEFVYYVDDNIMTGRTFRSANNFVKQCWDINKSRNGFSGVFALIVRTDDYAIRAIQDELLNIDNGGLQKSMFVFKYLRVPSLIAHHLACPICSRRQLYEDISNRCSLNSLKSIFLNKKRNLKLVEYSSYEKKEFLDYYPSISFADIEAATIEKVSLLNDAIKYKHLYKLHITDIVLGMYENEGNGHLFGDEVPFDDFVGFVYEKLKSLRSNERDKFQINLKFQSCKEYVIKVISLPPFVFYPNVKKSIFRWMIREAEDVINKQIANEDRLSFNDYRYLKLLLKRLASLQSNFLLRDETLTKLDHIYHLGATILKPLLGKIKIDRDKAIGLLSLSVSQKALMAGVNAKVVEDKVFQEKLEEIFSENNCAQFFQKHKLDILKGCKSIDIHNGSNPPELFRNLDNRIRLCCQLIYNLDKRLETINNYQYFLTACVKEVIHNNVAKALYVEERINNLLNSGNLKASKNSDFRHLLLLIKLENIAVVNQLVHKAYIEWEKELKGGFEFDPLVKLKGDYDSYDYIPLFEFIDLERKFLRLPGSRSETHTLFDDFFSFYGTLFRDIHPDLDKQKKDLPEKVQEILSFILKIMGVSEDVDIALYVKYKNAESNVIDYDERGNIYSFSNHTSLKKKVKSSSFILPMLEGISTYTHGPTQTFIEFVRRAGKYYSIVDNLYYQGEELDIYEKFEFSSKRYDHLFFFRVADIALSEGETNLTDDGLAVIFIGTRKLSNGKVTFFDYERTRYLLLINSLLSSFLRMNVANDSFRAYIDEKKANDSWNLYQHGKREYLESLQEEINKDQLLSRYRSVRDRINLWLLLYNQSYHINIMKETVENDLDADYVFPFITSTEFIGIINDVLNVIFNSSAIKRKISVLPERRGVLEQSKPFVLQMNHDLLKIILSELFINVKKHSEALSNEERWIEFNLVEYNDEMHLQIRNNYDKISEQKSQIPENPLGLVNQPHGLVMINDIYLQIYGNENFFYSKDKKQRIFKVSLPLIFFGYA